MSVIKTASDLQLSSIVISTSQFLEGDFFSSKNSFYTLTSLSFSKYNNNNKFTGHFPS